MILFFSDKCSCLFYKINYYSIKNIGLVLEISLAFVSLNQISNLQNISYTIKATNHHFTLMNFGESNFKMKVYGTLIVHHQMFMTLLTLTSLAFGNSLFTDFNGCKLKIVLA